MPKGDGMGPPRGGMGRGGRMSGNRPGVGPVGNCICPSCGEKVPHQRAVPCYSLKCPKCGTGLVRE